MLILTVQRIALIVIIVSAIVVAGAAAMTPAVIIQERDTVYVQASPVIEMETVIVPIAVKETVIVVATTTRENQPSLDIKQTALVERARTADARRATLRASTATAYPTRTTVPTETPIFAPDSSGNVDIPTETPTMYYYTPQPTK